MIKSTCSAVVSVCLIALFLSGCSSNSSNSGSSSGTPKQSSSSVAAGGVAPLLRIAKEARKTGNHDAATNFYNKVLQISPGNSEAYLGLAGIYIDANLLDAALGYLKKAEQYGADVNAARYLRGKIFLLQGNHRGAERILLQSECADAKNALGTIYDEREEHTKAQSMYKQVIAMDPNYIDAYNNLGLSFLLSEKYKEALFYLENACALPEANVAYRSNLAMAYGLSGSPSKARAVYAQDYEGDDLKERIAYLEDLIASRS